MEKYKSQYELEVAIAEKAAKKKQQEAETVVICILLAFVFLVISAFSGSGIFLVFMIFALLVAAFTGR